MYRKFLKALRTGKSDETQALENLKDSEAIGIIIRNYNTTDTGTVMIQREGKIITVTNLKPLGLLKQTNTVEEATKDIFLQMGGKLRKIFGCKIFIMHQYGGITPPYELEPLKDVYEY